MTRMGPLALLTALASACGGEDPASWSPEGTARGALGGYEQGRIWGWAQITGDPEPVEIRIDVDGEPIAIVVADGERPDLVRKGLHPTGEAGFELELDQELPRGADVNATIVATDTLLTNAPCRVQGDQGVSSCTEGQPRGILGGVRRSHDGRVRVWGWAQVIGRAEPVEIRIDVDGEPVTVVLADQPREDLRLKRLHPSGEAGFRADLGELPEDAFISAHIEGEGHQLLDGGG